MSQKLNTVEIPLNYYLKIDRKHSQDWQENITKKKKHALRSQDLVVKKSEFGCYCTI
jgi:hypothetical protein